MNKLLFGVGVFISLTVMCWASGSALGGSLGNQAGTVALGLAVGEQAHAVRTQANANVWIVLFVVIGMLGAMVIGYLIAQRPSSLPQGTQFSHPLPGSLTGYLPAGRTGSTPSIPSEQVLEQLLPGFESGKAMNERRR